MLNTNKIKKKSAPKSVPCGKFAEQNNYALRIKHYALNKAFHKKESALVRGKDEGKDYDIGLLGDPRNIGVRIFRSMLLSAANGPLLTTTGVNDRKLLIKAMKGSSRSVCASSRLQL